MSKSPQIAEVISQLARFTHREGRASELTTAQWCALRFFARAIRNSRTVTAFADYHHTTRGTASQTVESLVRRGLLLRTRSRLDRRTTFLELSDQGREVLKNDPFSILVQAIAKLPDDQRNGLFAILVPLMEQIAGQQNLRCLGTCGTCRHLVSPVTLADDGETHFCRKYNSIVVDLDLNSICMNYEPNDAVD